MLLTLQAAGGSDTLDQSCDVGTDGDKLDDRSPVVEDGGNSRFDVVGGAVLVAVFDGTLPWVSSENGPPEFGKEGGGHVGVADDAVGVPEQLFGAVAADLNEVVVDVGDVPLPVCFRDDVADVDDLFIVVEQAGFEAVVSLHAEVGFDEGEFPQKLFGVNRFDDEVPDPEPDRFLEIGGIAEGRGDDDRQLRRILTDLPDHLQPVHPRHFDVAQHDVGGRFGERLQCVESVAESADFTDLPAQHARQGLQQDGFVFDDDEGKLKHNRSFGNCPGDFYYYSAT